MSKPNSRWKGEPNQNASSRSSHACPQSHEDAKDDDQVDAAADTTADTNVPLPPRIPCELQTPADAVVHNEPPPITTALLLQNRPPRKRNSMTQDANQESSRKTSALPVHLKIADQESHRHRESKSWFSSILIHVVLLAMIAFFLVPGDYGGDGMHQLIVTIGDGSDPGAGAQFSTDNGIDDASLESVPASNDGQKSSSNSSGNQQGNAKDSSGTGKGGQQGPSGSFFGIETTGHEFVYILDMSGSMRGDRYARASEELLRSVDELSEGQKFYVILFSDTVVQMFDEDHFTPATVPATRLNKQRLANWIHGAFRGGSTDPREAVSLALRMNPSSIFMLSDGKFIESHQRTGKMDNLFDSNEDVFAMAKASGHRTPIQAIAFEETVACENMKRLSVLTGGKYRFVGTQDSEAAKLVLAQATAALKSGDLVKAERKLRELVAEYGNTESAWQGRTKLARIFFDEANNALRVGDLDVAGDTITQIIQMDPSAIATREYQKPLIDKLLRLAQHPTNATQSTHASNLIASLRNRFPKSKSIAAANGTVATQTLDEAQRLIGRNQPIDAFVNLDAQLVRLPTADSTSKLQDLRRQLADRLIARAQSIQRTQGDEAYTTHLQNLFAKTKDTSLRKRLVPLMSQLAVRMQSGSQIGIDQDAKASRVRLAQELTRDVGSSDLVKQAQLDATKAETRARGMMRSAQRVERMGDIASAMKRYSILVKTYPDTIAANNARQRFMALRRQQLSDLTQSSEMTLQQMVRDANSAKSTR